MPTKPLEPLDMDPLMDHWERLVQFSLTEAVTHIVQLGNADEPTATLQYMAWAEEMGYDPKSFMAGIAFGWGARELKGLAK